MRALWSPAPRRLAQQPELAHLALLDHQLFLLIAVLSQCHAGGGQPEMLTDHARAMVRVIRLLQLQLETYREMLEVMPPGGKDHGRV